MESKKKRMIEIETEVNRKVNFYFAPMEGITGYVYRNAHHRFYGNITQYFTPFIAPNSSRKLTSREMNDILPGNNANVPVVPQILTNRAEDFIWAAAKIQELGYKEINLNLGCPSGTVVAKNRGAGFLAFPLDLNRFLETVSREMERMGMKFSIKTRSGKDRPEEFEGLLMIFNQYPLERLILHPRVQADFYKNRPDWEVFGKAVRDSTNRVCYNGDLFTPEDIGVFTNQFVQVEEIMLGRGLLKNPALAEAAGGEEKPDENGFQRLRAFHDAVLQGYQEIIPGDRNVLFKMKELWSYLADGFSEGERLRKKIRKAGRMEEYLAAVERMFESCGLE